jgi:hypothetical protein
MPDMEQTRVEVNIGMCESQKLSGPQSAKVHKAQSGAQDCVARRRCPSSRQFCAGLQEALTLVSAEHARHKFLAHNPQGPAIRYDCAGIFET